MATLQLPQPQQHASDHDLIEDDFDSDDSINLFAQVANQPMDNNSCWETGFTVDEFLDWLHAVEEIMELKEVLDPKRISLLTMRLRERAQAWWQQNKNCHIRSGKGKITT